VLDGRGKNFDLGDRHRPEKYRGQLGFLHHQLVQRDIRLNQRMPRYWQRLELMLGRRSRNLL
jgi:hypothetical protein